MSDRLKQLEDFYQEEPNDPFNIYGLALEYQKTDAKKAMALFELLLTEHPHYIPTYYHAAKLLADMNEKDRAIQVYEKGIEQSKLARDTKALRELQSAYNELMFE